MATKKQVSYDIVNGPSREELFDALRLCDERGPNDPRTTVFTVSFGYEKASNERERSTHFVVNGIVSDGQLDDGYVLDLNGGPEWGPMKATYNVRLRRGRIRSSDLPSGPTFLFRGAARFPGTTGLTISGVGFDKSSDEPQLLHVWSGTFLGAFFGYSEPASDACGLAVCEFLGTPKDSYILKVLGDGIKVTLAQLIWAVHLDDLIEPDWTYIAYVTAPDGLDRVFKIWKGEKQITLDCQALNSVGFWASNIRVLGRNRFCPQF